LIFSSIENQNQLSRARRKKCGTPLNSKLKMMGIYGIP